MLEEMGFKLKDGVSAVHRAGKGSPGTGQEYKALEWGTSLGSLGGD